VGSLFILRLAYAEKLKPDEIYILSALHHLLDLDTEIEPYDLTLDRMSADERRQWSVHVLRQLQARVDVANDQIVFLAGFRYRQYLVPSIAHAEIRLERFPMAMQQQELRRLLNE